MYVVPRRAVEQIMHPLPSTLAEDVSTRPGPSPSPAAPPAPAAVVVPLAGGGARDHHDGVYYYIGERLKLEGKTENSGV